MHQQLSLFEISELEQIRHDMGVLKKEVANLRRGLFGRFDKLSSDVITIKEDQTVFCEFLGESMENLRKIYIKNPDIDWVDAINV